MAEEQDRATHRDEDLRRVATEIAGRLTSRGVALSGQERPEQLLAIEEAIQRFEDAVEALGGDLMVDEPPRGRTPQPDDPHFALPRRHEGESVEQYVQRLNQARKALQHHPPRAD